MWHKTQQNGIVNLNKVQHVYIVFSDTSDKACVMAKFDCNPDGSENILCLRECESKELAEACMNMIWKLDE